MKKILFVTLAIQIGDLDPEGLENHIENGDDPLGSVGTLDPVELSLLIAETVAELPEMFDGILMPCQVMAVEVVGCGFEVPRAA